MAKNIERRWSSSLIKFISISLCSVLIFLLVNACMFTGSREFPKKTGLKQITLNATYHGQELTIKQTLYKSADQYYSSDPDKEDFGNKYSSFVFSYKEDKTIKELAQNIKSLGRKLGLTDDQTMDLATSFVQNIPYDKEKGALVLSGDGDSGETIGRFPYETLYDNKGICTDKSYLMAAIIKEMGYGVSIMVFDKEKHMAVGVKTPSGYTSLNTKYSYLETTNTGFKVGQLPSINDKEGGANNPQINNFPKNGGSDYLKQIPDSNFTPPTEVDKVADGKEYQRIIEITNDLNRIKELIPQINSEVKDVIALKEELNNENSAVENAKNETAGFEGKMNEAESTYKANPTPGNYSAYKQAYNGYQASFYKTKGIIDRYNSKVNNINLKNDKLNSLINEYNNLVASG